MIIAPTLLLSLLLSASAADDPAEEAAPPPCYDVAVRAKLIDQVPSLMPECDDCIIMSWPWFLDLKVAKVLEGSIDAKTITALNVQHTYLQSRYGVWRLRRNTAGGFNVVRTGASGELPLKCTPAMAPPKPYIRSKDKTLDDLRNEGFGYYGHFPKR
ncbi:hypothetical protein FHW92_002198 [Novosphingobium sp. SG707]|nr:hypothetical protein [Novosphingobium sp. SG707]